MWHFCNLPNKGSLLFRVPLKLLLVATAFVSILIISLAIKKLLESSKIKKKNQIQPIIIQFEEIQSNQVNLNNNTHNPEIFGTSISIIICLLSFVIWILILYQYNSKFSLATDFLALSKEFLIIQYELIPHYCSSFLVPLGLYYQNENFRKFLKNHYRTIYN